MEYPGPYGKGYRRGKKTAADLLLAGRTRVGHGRPGETLGSSWIPLPIRAWEYGHGSSLQGWVFRSDMITIAFLAFQTCDRLARTLLEAQNEARRSPKRSPT
jgi:hypothetical protein